MHNLVLPLLANKVRVLPAADQKVATCGSHVHSVRISDKRRCLYTGQGWLQSLEIENERLQGELDALRQRAVSTPQHELRAKNERLTAQLREVEKSDKTRTQLGFEVAQLKQELGKLRRSNGKNSTAALRRQVKVIVLGKMHCWGSYAVALAKMDHACCSLRLSKLY